MVEPVNEKTSSVESTGETIAPTTEADPVGPELFFALVGAVGTDLASVADLLTKSLKEVNYKSEPIRLSELIHDIPRWENLPQTPEDKRIDEHMTAGNDFRKTLGSGDALTLLAIGAIRELRKISTGTPTEPIKRCAYLLNSLKHPKEVVTLRKIYGQGFFLIAAYSPREVRLQELARKIAHSYFSNRTTDYLDKAHALNKRDEEEVGVKVGQEEVGQNVRATFPLPDVFINTNDPDAMHRSINRFIELIFGYPFHTPSRDEYGMFHAQAAALRSASLSRQVGAVISTQDGDIIAVGTNEVPKAGGGLYWSDDMVDHRDFTLGYDTNDRMKRNTLAELLNNLKKNGWLAQEKATRDIDDLVKEALEEGKSQPLADAGQPVTKNTQLMDLIEFGRSEHAETAALLDAARRGASVKGSNLYTTTFPCHDCAKHLVTAGLQRVFYIQPYPKSLAVELHSDSIAVDTPGECQGRVTFVPFVGVAPRRYMDFFTMVERKDQSGRVIGWTKSEANPRFLEPATAYIGKESLEFKSLVDKLKEKNLMPKKEVYHD